MSESDDSFDFDGYIESQAKNLEDLVVELKLPNNSGPRQKWLELVFQINLFAFSLALELRALSRNKLSGFARKVTLRGLVHILYEFDVALRSHFLLHVEECARNNGMPFDRSAAQHARIEWKADFRVVRKWEKVRNQTTGHFGDGALDTVSEIESLESTVIAKAAISVMQYLILLLSNSFVEKEA